MKTLDLGTKVGFELRGTNRSVVAARWFLQKMGLRIIDAADNDGGWPVIEAGVPGAGPREGAAAFVVRLWDFHVGLHGTGLHASAVSGVSWVLGVPGKPPLALPLAIPEKWCALLGISLGMTCFAERLLTGPPSRRRIFEVSAAETLRCFADQNFGNHRNIPESWRRNGRVAADHGGIYPQCFLPCKDGFVGMVARSRNDWHSILEAVGKPAWAVGDLLDPFLLAEHPEMADDLLSAELLKFTRDELLERAIATGATIAPVYEEPEVRGKMIVREDFFEPSGDPGMPFKFTPPAVRERSR